MQLASRPSSSLPKRPARRTPHRKRCLKSFRTFRLLDGRDYLFPASTAAAALGMLWRARQRQVCEGMRTPLPPHTLQQLWEAYLDEHHLTPVVTNTQCDKVKRCRIELQSTMAEGEGATWDQARKQAVWQALQSLSPQLCSSWRDSHPVFPNTQA